MLVAKNIVGEKIIGWEANKDESYYCPSCEEELVLRQGEIKIHHFSHMAETGCAYSVGETQKHILMKKNIYQILQNSNHYKKIELEYKIDDKIADVYLINRSNKKIAVECQVSPLDIIEFRKKTAYYSYRDVYVLWVFSGNTVLDKLILKLANTKDGRLNYRSTEVERKCHRWYYGRMYYFYNGQIYAIHFYPVERWIPDSCDECLDQVQCRFKNPKECQKYSMGYFNKPKSLKEISICHIKNVKLDCIDRKDRLRIAKFNEPAWWKI